MGQALKRAPRRATAASKRQVVGSKGGSAKQKQPSIASNSVPSIATVRMLYLWSWGPIVGPVNGLRSVKLDGTPVMAEDGSLTYPGVKWQFRSGELNQERMTGISESSNEIAVGQQLLSTTPYVYTITNSMLDAVRLRFSWPQLQSQDSGGNIDGVRIEYAVDVSTDNGPFQQVLASEVNRKNVTKYERSHRIDLPTGSRWAIRARRITPEANSSLVQDGMYVEAIAEVVDSDQEYPLTAVSCVEYDAEQFGGDIAKIAVLMRGRIVRVPMNYDPVNRTYATSGPGTTNGVWDGTFKEAYTNNPAWVFFDLALHPYYGLGDRIDATMINRWSLYRIGQYCDQLVPDGLGGQEPRFTCNLYLQKQAEAWAVLQDLAAIFHGLAFWDGSQITVNADMPQDPVYNYTLSQILDDGAVKYTGSKLRDRHSQAMVSFDDPDRGYDTDKEPVFDESAIAEYGVREISVEAVGCTSRGQAQRAGQWALMTEQLQLRGASFRVGLDGYIPKPGKVITLSDPMLAGRANGGRIAAVAGRVVTVDRDIEVPTGARLLVNLPSGKSEARQVRSVAGRQITVMADFSEVPQPESGWVLDFDDLKLMQFYVRNVTRPEWHQFQLECIQYEPSKFDAIDYGTVIDDRPISVLPPGVQDAPARVLIGSHSSVDQGMAVTTMTISWDAAPGAVAYDVEWRWGSRDWVKVPRTGELAADVRGVYAGQYLARVRAVSSMDVSSIPTTSMLTNVAGKTTPPPAVTHLATESLLFGIKVTWGFPAGAEDTQRTELWYSEGTDLGVATKLADLAYPQNEHVMQGLRAGQRFFFWARLVDRTGNLGPFFPVAPTVISGTASADASPILEQIAGEILESHLGKELTDRIDLIDKDGPGSVNERIGEVRSDLNEQISDVNNHVNEVQNELQHQIDMIADLADSMPYKPDQAYTAGQSVLGDDGRLYQAKIDVPAGSPPPNATYWTDIGQAVQTANGMAARVQTVETKVQNLEGTSSAQAQQITGLQSSLTTTNGNVTAAQQAAQDAAALAGGKGKVIVQSAAPAAADRLAQNLWIDTTGNANAPKRWNGSAWVAVTDKVATDAAAAAANALAVAQTKADASVVQSLTTRVTDAEGALSSQGQAMTGLQNSLTTTNQNVTAAQQAAQAAADAAGTKGKVLYQSTAPAVADRLTQNLWIDTTSNANTPKRWNGSAWVAVTDKVATDAAAAAASALNQVATKADASTVQALSNTVDQQGALITANGQAITNINTSLTGLGGGKANLLPAEYCVFGPTLPTLSGSSFTASSVVDPAAMRGYALKLDWALTSTALAVHFSTSVAAAGMNMALRNKRYIVSYYAKASVAGHQVANYIRVLQADGVTTATGSAALATLSTEWARYSVVIDMSSSTFTGSRMQLSFQMNRSGVADRSVWLDRIMVEEAAEGATTPSAFVVGNSFDQSQLNASATSALSARVATTEAGLTSTSGSLTELRNSIGDVGGANLLYNPSFDKTGSGGVAEGWTYTGAANTTRIPSLVPSALAPTELAQRLDMTGLSQSLWVRIQPDPSKRPSVAPGQTLTFSVYMRGTAGLTLRPEILFRDAQGAVTGSKQGANTVATNAFQRLSVSTIVPEGSATADVYPVCFGTSALSAGFIEIDRAQLELSTTMSGWRDNGQVNAAANTATSAAVDGLSSTVSQQGGTLTSVANRTTTLENSVNSATNGLATKASASALESVSNRVSATEGGLASASSSVIDLKNTLGAMNGGVNLIPAEYSVFGATSPAINKQANMTVSTVANATAAGKYLLKLESTVPQVNYFYLASGGADWTMKLKPGKKYILSFWVQADAARAMSLRIRYPNSAGTTVEAELAQVNATTALTRVSAVMTMPAALVDSCCLVFYQTRTAATSSHLYDGFMLEEQVGSNEAPSSFSVGYSARETQATSRALSELSSTVTTQGGTISAQAQQITGLQTSVGNNTAAIQSEATTRSNADTALGRRVDTVQSNLGTTNASVQQVSTAQANLDGKVNATWSVKLGLTSGGSYYAAGFGLGLENQGGTFQSSFVVLANRFAVLNPVGEGLISPFAIQNGQVFISDALISNLSVQKAIVGNSINSSELANDGTPIMRMDFASGTMILLNKAATAYTVYNRRGIDMVINGVRRIRMGEWD